MRISDWSSDVCSSDLSELVAIRAEHIERDAEGAGTLFIPSSKTDQAGEGAYAYLAPATMVAIARWRDAGHNDRGALFRRVETHFDGSVAGVGRAALHPNRSEEHTSELQSLMRISYADYCLNKIKSTA